MPSPSSPAEDRTPGAAADSPDPGAGSLAGSLSGSLSGIDITPEPPISPATLRYLKWLVTVLTATMIIGIATLVILLALRLSERQSAPLPEAITLPDGARATAFTRGPDWLAVVTDDGRILIFAPDGKTLRQEIRIEGAP